MGELIFCWVFLFFCLVNAGSDHQGHATLRRQTRDVLGEDQCEEWSDKHVIGDCESYNGAPCLCELDSCAYDHSSGTCLKAMDCTMYDDKPVACRHSHCIYECGSGACLTNSDGTCDECGQHCGDICSCKAGNCQYSYSGRCQRQGTLACPDTYEDTQCQRRNAFYNRKGIICKNIREHSNCAIEKTVLAVNFGQTSVVDSQGILYQPHATINHQDVHGIKLLKRLTEKDGFTADQQKLYDQILIANTTKREHGRCITFKLPVCEDGNYELVIHTIEAFDVLQGEKLFNILLGYQYVFQEVDVMQLAGNRNVPIQLILNFKVHKNILTIAGQAPILIRNSTVPLSFCFGECIFFEGYFEIAAFSVNKFLDLGKVNTNKQECAEYKGEHWDCVTSNCEYEQTSRLCKPSNATCKALCADTCKFEHLEMVFLVDSTSSQPEADSIPFDYLPTFINIIDNFRDFQTTKFGLALFSDFECAAWFGQAKCTDPLNTPHDSHVDPNGCYRLHEPLTENKQLIKQRTQRQHLSIRRSGGHEPALFDAMMATEDVLMRWSPGVPSKTAKVIVIIADDGNHHQRLGGPEAKFDGTDICNTNAPHWPDLERYFVEQGIHLFILLNKSTQKASFDSLSRDMPKVPLEFGFFREDNEVLRQRIMKLVNAQYRKRNNCTSEEDPIDQ